jgi:hypothetical protein
LPQYSIWICLLFVVWRLSRLPYLLAYVPTAVFNTQSIAALLYGFFLQVSGVVWETLHFYWWSSDLRSDLSNGPNWVGAFPPFCQKMEIDAVTEMFSVWNVRKRWTQARNPVIVICIHDVNSNPPYFNFLYCRKWSQLCPGSVGNYVKDITNIAGYGSSFVHIFKKKNKGCLEATSWFKW